MNIETWKPSELDQMVYTRFSEHIPTKRRVYEELISQKPDWSGNVITTLSAGWPLVFQSWGARSCVVVERNAAQVRYIDKKYGTTELPEIKSFLDECTQVHVADFMDLPERFWEGKVFGDEYVFLSNIGDHAKSEGRAVDFAQQIGSIVNSAPTVKNLNIVLSSFGREGFGEYLDLITDVAANNGLSLDLDFYNSGEVNTALINEYAVFTLNAG